MTKNERLAIELASMLDTFEDDEDPETVVRTVLEAQLQSIKDREETAEAEQARLREQILPGDTDDSDALSRDSEELSEIEAEQQRLKEDILDD